MEFITSGDRIATENFSIGKIYTVTFTNGNYFINTCVGIGPDFVMFQQEAPKMLFCLDMESAETVSSIDESGGGSGTMNYNELDNKPSINGVTLIGNKTAADLSILPVPIVEEYDNNKILTASYSGGVGSYSWQPAPSSGTSDYTQLTNKPQINSVELNGNKSLSDLGIASAEALAGKQDIISDLNTIRSGAAAGATAVQPATLADYQTLIDSTHKLSSDLVDDTGHTNKFATAAQLTQIETNKTNILSKCVYGTCSTAAATAAKVVDVPSGFVLQTGCIVGVLFSNTNSATDVTLNVGNTGAIALAYSNYRPYTNFLSKITGYKNTIIYYMYDGTYWNFIANSLIYSNMAQSEASTGTSTTERYISAKVLSDTIDEKLVPVNSNILTLQGQFKRSATAITDNIADNASSGTLYGQISLTDITDAWGALITYVLNSEGSRVIQLLYTENRNLRRFKGSGGWGAWADI